MKVRVIYDPILRQKAESVSVFDASLKELADGMTKTMRNNQGIGLSANQVGLATRLIVLGYKSSGEEDDLPDVPFQQLCNPVIKKFSKEQEVMLEGCLSLPGLELPVKRPVGVTVEAQDLTGKPVTIKAKGLHARVLQHEIDHINGILFTDRVANINKVKDYYFAKIVFCGTDEFSKVVLEDLVSSGLDIFSVITETSKPSGRGHQLKDPVVKEYAKSQDIAVFQPDSKEDLVYTIKQLKPDLLVLASYGKILPSEALEVPVFGCLNVHPSLLPKYRGATPIQSALLNGDKETGVTIMQMAPQVDAGGIITQAKYSVTDEATTESLKLELAQLGASLLVKTIPAYLAGQSAITIQDEDKVNKTKKLTKEMGQIDWEKDAVVIEREIRALNPWPGTFTYLNGKLLKILEARITNKQLDLITVQLEGKKPAKWTDFRRGYKEQLTNEQWYGKISQ